MKKIIFIFLMIFTSLDLCAQLGYHYEGKFVQLTPSRGEHYYVEIRSKESKTSLENITKEKSFLRNNDDIAYILSEKSFLVSSKLSILEKDYISELFLDTEGNPYYILPHIILSIDDNISIKDVLKGYSGILTVDPVQRLKGMYTISCTRTTATDVLKIVSELETRVGVEWCEPDMICKWETHSMNPFYAMQYYIKNNNPGHYDINVVPAWGLVTGNASITVAVIDEGVDFDHEDLREKVLQGYTIEDETGYGKPKNANALNYKGHGVACAGIIGGKNNDKGILGVAYGVNLLPINVAPGIPYEYYINGIRFIDSGFTHSNSELAYAIQWASERADILSCSWGSNSENSTVKTAIINALNNGRSGKGCVVVASAGNDYNGTLGLKFPAQMEGVIAVGAINKFGNIHNYSQRGDNLDLVAPSGRCNLEGDIVTTDRMGDLGYNPNAQSNATELTNRNYTQRFGGTSAACPQVAGVAALMLSANPNLTASQVREILRSTAKDLGAPGFDTTYGYGLVDAYAAVYAVAAHDISGPQFVYTAGSYSVSNLQDGATVEWILSDNFYNQHCLQQNYPAQNQCTITYSSGHYMINATLTATIKYNGNTIQTLTKTVSAYDDFHGQYTSDNLSGEIDGTHQFYVKPNVVSTITSPMFQGALVSYDYDGTIPTTFNFSVGQRKLYFTMPANNNGKPVIINVEDFCGNHYKLYAMPYNSYYMNIAYGDGNIDIELKETVTEDSKSEALKTMKTANDQTWKYEIWSSASGTLKVAQTINSRSTTISTVGWPKGVYIIKAKIGKEEVTEKIDVK